MSEIDVKAMDDVALASLLLGQKTAARVVAGAGSLVAAAVNGTHPRLAAALEVTRRVMLADLDGRDVLNSPQAVTDYLRLTCGRLEHEVFGVLFLDAQHRLIAGEEMFRGTLTQTSVYPREVVKRALRHNAGAVLLWHNHPSGVCEPSRADELLTQSLSRALDLVDVRVLDHIIVTGAASISFAQRGLL